MGRTGSLARAALAFAVWLALGAAPTARAHGVDWVQVPGGETVAFSFFYSDGTPMAYAAVSVIGPESANIPFQKGRTDKLGYFAFRPNVSGQWRFEVSDGQGHFVSGETYVSPQAAPGATLGEAGAASGEGDQAPLARRGGARPGAMEALLGLSLILNVFFVAARVRRRARPPARA
ncbi:MAG: DUF4198 domain-containing protein [Deltaproteobacteria bacterium]|jgi:nickel transport protein|nr:DUF4198 domain-containing protein [Deltaproteobacteria bacterium]